ncbi:unnamed protein product, partial [Ectocarpus sp. 12 AP-2014]
PFLHRPAATPPPSPSPSATPTLCDSSHRAVHWCPIDRAVHWCPIDRSVSHDQRGKYDQPDSAGGGQPSLSPGRGANLRTSPSHRDPDGQTVDTARQNRGRTQSFRSAPTSGGGPYTSRSTPRNGNNRGGGNSSRPTPRERPRCSHPSCRKPLGHTTETCFQRKREEAQAAKNRRENNRPMAKRSCAEDRIPRKDHNNDDSDA